MDNTKELFGIRLHWPWPCCLLFQLRLQFTLVPPPLLVLPPFLPPLQLLRCHALITWLSGNKSGGGQWLKRIRISSPILNYAFWPSTFYFKMTPIHQRHQGRWEWRHSSSFPASQLIRDDWVVSGIQKPDLTADRRHLWRDLLSGRHAIVAAGVLMSSQVFVQT